MRGYNAVMGITPSTNGRNGGGRFTKGNPGGPGNPHAKQAARFRTMICEAVSDEDLVEIVGMLVKRAKDGDVGAAKELLNRLVGKPDVALDGERLQLEKALLRLRERGVEVAEDRELFRGL